MLMTFLASRFSKKNTARFFLLAVFMCSLVSSGIYLYFFKNIGPAEHQVPGTDYVIRYEPLAENLLAGKGISMGPEDQVTSTPGYPFILLALLIIAKVTGMSELTVIVIANIAMTALSVCFLFLIAQMIFNRNVALIAAFLWSIYPLNLWLIKNPNTEVPFILLFYFCLWLTIKSVKEQKPRRMVIVGLLMGFALLIRPFGLFLPLVFLVSFWLVTHVQSRESQLTKHHQPIKKSIRYGALFIIGCLLTITPWIWYASLKTGHFIPLSSLGPTAITVGLSYAYVGNGQHQQDVSVDIRALMGRVRATSLQSSTDIARFLAGELIQHPLALIKLLGLKLTRSWYATYGMWWENEIALLQIPFLILGLTGIYISLKTDTAKKFAREIPWIYSLLTFILYFWAMTFVSLSIVRYMLPVMGFVMIFAAVAINEFLERHAFSPEKMVLRLTNFHLRR